MENIELKLTDAVISLRPFTIDDAKAHLAGEDDEQVKWLNEGKASTIESVRAWIGWNEESWHAGGPIYNFAIVGEDGKLAGMVEANTDTENMTGLRPGDANVSYNIYPAARGKGHATRAVNLMEHYLAGMGIQRSVLRIDPDNETSLGVPTRLGYHEHDRIPTPDGTTLRMFIKEL